MYFSEFYFPVKQNYFDVNNLDAQTVCWMSKGQCS